ncbi:MAG: hypothetical protein JO227_19015 [Acetobacteraceae bacterium]|nr:hypothetical protein [Acetobacteraceae bacterium]
MDQTFVEALLRAKHQLLDKQKSLIEELGNGQFDRLWMLPQLRDGLREIDRLIQRERAKAEFRRTGDRAAEVTALLADRSKKFASDVEGWVRERLGRGSG